VGFVNGNLSDERFTLLSLRWKDPEAPHSAENVSKTITIYLIRVEMKE